MDVKFVLKLLYLFQNLPTEEIHKEEFIWEEIRGDG